MELSGPDAVAGNLNQADIAAFSSASLEANSKGFSGSIPVIDAALAVNAIKVSTKSMSGQFVNRIFDVRA